MSDTTRSVSRTMNTLTKRTEPIVVSDPSRVTFYTCGPTVYDDAHIGNFRSFLAADVMRRWLESELCAVQTPDGEVHAGPREVVHVMNITDVGHMTDDDQADGGGLDKMAVAGERIKEAKKAGTLPADAEVDPNDPRQIAEFYTGRFIEDATALGLKVAAEAGKDRSLMPRATEHVDGMITLTERLIETGHAYVAGEEGARAVYFRVSSFPSYGVLSGNTLDNLRGGAGGRVSDSHQSEKEHPADFLLWKEDASHLMKWDSPWGAGYPGWHVECSVMSVERLVPGGLSRVLKSPPSDSLIDLHSGGEDNIFPHHECERAQSCAACGVERFARHWFHPRFLMVNGSKMSKSKGTFFTARDLFAQGHEPAALRLELIKTHYRANADFSIEGLRASAKMVGSWRRFVAAGEGSAEEGEPNAAVRDAVARTMADDLNIAGAIGAINAWIRATPSPTRADARVMRTFDGFLGVLDLEKPESKSTGIAVYMPGVEPDPAIDEALGARLEAKKAKDFARADQIRDELSARGLSIKDVAGGKVEVSRS